MIVLGDGLHHIVVRIGLAKVDLLDFFVETLEKIVAHNKFNEQNSGAKGACAAETRVEAVSITPKAAGEARTVLADPGAIEVQECGRRAL